LDGDQPVARPLHTHRTTQTQNKPIQTSILLVGFEPTTPAFERAKTLRALDLAATVVGNVSIYSALWFDDADFIVPNGRMIDE
jgi:hypothetical protein